ncbi:MAG: bifunctional precorrin-2 dehydrogenase/sirohydrochlorin ferrochelatase [Candidatus Bathyarchaeota archaeon]|nr:bifunctional precorrin-2 dehydrogenase/sirohydrochlorin ferrochelatase [Candidatus Bathyarchaeota archaeon]
MLIDFKIVGKHVVIIGGGAEGYRKTTDFLEAGASILVVSKSFSEKIKQLAQKDRIKLRQEEVQSAVTFLSNVNPKPDIIVAVTNNHQLNAELVKFSKSRRWMVYAPDNPEESDFTLPAVTKVGDIQIGISTGGKSPVMASVLRRRIENLVTYEDLLQVKLQNHIRKTLRHKVQEQKIRKELLYSIVENLEIKKALKEGKLQEAQERAKQIIEKHLERNEKL